MLSTAKDLDLARGLVGATMHRRDQSRRVSRHDDLTVALIRHRSEKVCNHFDSPRMHSVFGLLECDQFSRPRIRSQTAKREDSKSSFGENSRRIGGPILADDNVESTSPRIQVDVKVIDRRNSSAQCPAYRAEILAMSLARFQAIEKGCDPLSTRADVGYLSRWLRLAHRDSRIEIIGLPGRQLTTETVEIGIPVLACKLPIRNQRMTYAQRLKARSSGFSELTDDKRVPGTLDPWLLVVTPVPFEPDQKLIRHFQQAGLRLDTDSRPVPEGLASSLFCGTSRRADGPNFGFQSKL